MTTSKHDNMRGADGADVRGNEQQPATYRTAAILSREVLHFFRPWDFVHHLWSGLNA